MRVKYRGISRATAEIPPRENLPPVPSRLSPRVPASKEDVRDISGTVEYASAAANFVSSLLLSLSLANEWASDVEK